MQLFDQPYCLRNEDGSYSPAIDFNGREYRWASTYGSPTDATQVARQLLHSAQDHGRVP